MRDRIAARGRQSTSRMSQYRSLTKRFGNLPESARDKLSVLPVEQVELLMEKNRFYMAPRASCKRKTGA